MPVGPSYMLRTAPYRSRTTGSALDNPTGSGRVCGASASRAPRHTSRVASAESAKASSSAQKPRQRIDGSMPSTRITSWSRSSGEATSRVVLGHVIRRAPSTVLMRGRLTCRS